MLPSAYRTAKNQYLLPRRHLHACRKDVELPRFDLRQQTRIYSYQYTQCGAAIAGDQWRQAVRRLIVGTRASHNAGRRGRCGAVRSLPLFTRARSAGAGACSFQILNRNVHSSALRILLHIPRFFFNWNATPVSSASLSAAGLL